MEVLYGFNAIIEALDAGRREFKEIIVSRERYDEILYKARGIPIVRATSKDLDRISGTRSHQGVVARVSSYAYAGLEDVAPTGVVLVADTVEDPQNLGSMVRSAYALAGSGIVIAERRCASITPAVVKASAGATEHARIAKVKNLARAMDKLKEWGFWLVGLDASVDTTIQEVPTLEKIAIVIGGEATGLRPRVMKKLDVVVSIPMRRRFNSLNVSHSAAIGLYELVVRRKGGIDPEFKGG